MCCALPAASFSTAIAAEGRETVIYLDRASLNGMELEVGLPDAELGALDPAWNRDAIRLSIEDGDIADGAESNPASVSHMDDIVIRSADGRVRLTGSRIASFDHEGLRRYAIFSGRGDLSGPMLLLQDEKVGFDGGGNRLVVEASALIITSDLANALGEPKLAGRSIGRIEVTGYTPSDQELNAEPLDVDEDAPGGGEGEPRGEICGASSGPDVIVGELGKATGPVDDIWNSASQQVGPNWIDVFSLATYSCNIGNAQLSWVAGGSAQHPVIGQNFYRYYTAADGATRFEQIGQSWLKHGFTALQHNICCTCQNSGTGSALGVGCADPYTASRNAGQNGAGPKWQVNPSTGQHIHPIDNTPGYPATVGRRLQVKISDLDLPGAIYFGEGQYVAADDAASGNQNNNASYRRITVSGTGNDRTFGFLAGGPGATQRGEAGVRAWKDQDASVTETNIQADGLLILAAKATSLGGGLFHYEYALQNLNSHRGVKAFRIPVNPASTISNAGFHDVDYHDFDGEDGDAVANDQPTRDGTDWAVSTSGGAVTWTMSSVTPEANSNALLWGTVYNFRFDCNAAPTTVNAMLTMFRSGSPATVSGSTVGPAAGPQDCQPNGVEDTIDITSGASQDCNLNGVPDECETLEPCTLAFDSVITGLSQPLGVYAPPGDTGRIFIVEQTGRIKIATLPTYALNATPYLNVSGLLPAPLGGEQGLLGLAFHPDWSNNGYFYINYTNSAGDTVIARYQALGGNPAASTADPAQTQLLPPIDQPFVNHNGGCLQFGHDGMLYCGMGDGGSANDPGNRAQNDGMLLGKMLRLDVDNPPTYVPVDNPYVGAGNPLDEIWAKGLRNPWRFSF
ncbi:MAG TPA: PQQ-dependent sugar dehydrogenase, partial [Phycisphaerae bacterium]|nr:PQQ-dependent sugar dehydrogenase [Phycisphaerae bacterium]